MILSGMGSDGTLGLGAIKENAGLALVQEPASAKFDAMQRNAIEAGLADIIAPAQELTRHILAFVHHTPLGIPSTVNPESIRPLKSQSALEQIIILLREHTGNDFSLYKKTPLFDPIVQTDSRRYRAPPNMTPPPRIR